MFHRFVVLVGLVSVGFGDLEFADPLSEISIYRNWYLAAYVNEKISDKRWRPRLCLHRCQTTGSITREWNAALWKQHLQLKEKSIYINLKRAFCLY